jgi:ribonuclease BN (tRNA processing enzyme)
MDVQFLGCGDAFGSGGRFNTCFRVTTGAGAFLIDCGASSLIAMRKFGVDPNSVETVFISHLHLDHCGGLPFMIVDGQFQSRRGAPLTIAGPVGLRDDLTRAMEFCFPGSSAMALRFPLEVIEIEAGATVMINGTTVTSFLAEHGTDTPALALRFAREGKVVAYTGDTEWTETLLPLGRDADLLIAQSMFFERKVKNHLDYATLKANLGRIGARRVILTHMGPEMLAHLAQVTEETAEDGMVVRV